MKINRYTVALAFSAGALAASAAFAQRDEGPRAGGAPPGVPEPIAPSEQFNSSTAHYEFLHDLYDGGVTHTYDSVPKWEGIWSASGNTVARGGNLFRDDNGDIIPGVLTPEYEAAYQHRLDLGINWDRLTTCEPAGMPRWLLEPYTREFVNTPTQSWWLNDLGNDTRRIYINQEHQNIDGTHYPNGDSVGFWTEDNRLIVHTVDVYPNDYFRAMPPTSNQFETVEIWWQETMPNGEVRVVTNITMYDELSLEEPITATYTFERRPQLEQNGYRIRHWECESNDNTYLTRDNQGNPSTQFLLPGDEGFNDPRGVDPNRNPDLPEDLPGQSKNPIFNDSVQ